MPILWSTFKTQLRRGILRDAGADRWDDNMLSDAIGWALQQFVIHTALPAVANLTVPTPAVTEYDLPTDLYDDPMATMLVQYRNGTTVEFLEPIELKPGATWREATPTSSSTPRGYYVWPSDKLQLQFLPTAGTTLRLQYYAEWVVPTQENETLAVPNWAIYPISLLTAAFLQVPDELALNVIRAHITRVDSGNPEQNPHAESAKRLVQMYHEWLNQHPPQQRQRHFIEGSGL